MVSRWTNPWPKLEALGVCLGIGVRTGGGAGPATARRAFFLVDPVGALVAHGPALPSQEDVKPPILLSLCHPRSKGGQIWLPHIQLHKIALERPVSCNRLALIVQCRLTIVVLKKATCWGGLGLGERWEGRKTDKAHGDLRLGEPKAGSRIHEKGEQKAICRGCDAPAGGDRSRTTVSD